MYVLVSVFVILVSILLILTVLVQNSKGGGLAANFQSSGQMMGVRRTADFLEKFTWSLAVALLVLSFVSVMVLPKAEMRGHSVIDQQMHNVIPPAQEVPAFPIPEDDIPGMDGVDINDMGE